MFFVFLFKNASGDPHPHPAQIALFLGAAVIRRRFQLSRLSCLFYFDLMSVCMTGSLVSDQLIV